MEQPCRICYTCQKEGNLEDGTACPNCYTCQKEGTDNTIMRQTTCDNPNCKNPQHQVKGGLKGGPPMGRGVFGQRVHSGRGDPQHPWINSLTLFPTNLCNLRCDYCFIYKYERNFGETVHMTMDTFKRVVPWLGMVSGPNREMTIHFFGGEPLVAFPFIKEAVEWANEYLKGTGKKMKWGVTSNMTLITDEVNEFLKEHNFNVLVSIDGMSKSHDKHRVREDGSGSWDAAIKGLDKVLEWKKDGKMPTLRWTITPDTIKGLYEGTKYFVEEKGFMNIAHEMVYEAEWDDKTLKQLEAELTKAIPFMIKKLKNGIRLDLKSYRDGMRAFTLKQRMSDRCGLAKGDCGMDVDGNVFNCHRFVDQMDHYLGNINDGLDYPKMAKINSSWSHDKITPWSGDKSDCNVCIARNMCNAGCLAVNYDTTGSIYKVPKSFCDISVVKVRLAHKLKKRLIKEGLWEKWNQSNKGNPFG